MLIASKDAKMRALGWFTKAEIKELRETYPELRGMDDSSVTEEVIMRIQANRAAAHREWLAKLPELKAQAQAAYDAEVARYLSKNPNGKNAKKAGIRKAREIWSGFQA